MNTTIRFALLAIVSLLPVAASSVARADVGVVESTGAFLLTGGTTYISTIGAGQNPRWAGYSFGTFDVSAGQSLNLTNFFFENYAYNGGSIPPGGSFNNNWLDNGSVAVFRLFRDASQIYQTSLRQSNVSGNNRNWDIVASGTSVDVLAGLSSGTHTLSYVIDWNYNQWTGSAVLTGSTQSTSSGVATFAVVPEPSSLAVLVAGMAEASGLAVRRCAARRPAV
jgi:hypothetical protein